MTEPNKWKVNKGNLKTVESYSAWSTPVIWSVSRSGSSRKFL